MRRQLLIIFLTVALILGAAIYIGGGGVQKVSNKPRVVASFYVLAELAREVGGDRVDVAGITPPGVEPHDYEPSSRQVRQVFAAKVFLFNGGGFDSWAQKLAPDAKNEGVVTRDMSSYFPLRKARGEDREGLDPHIWLDPVLAQKEVRIIRDALIKADPKNSAVYRKNAAAYMGKLAALNKAYRDGLTGCRTRKAVTSHAAFGYLARRYDLEVLPISISPNAEPSPRRIGEISRLVKKEKIKYIFFEPLVSPKVARTIARETGAKTLVFNPIEGLTAKEAARGENYISLMKKNLKNLRLALGCE